MQNTYDVLHASGSGDSLPSMTQAYYDRKLLKRGERKLVHEQYGQQRPLKRRTGMQIMFRRWEKLAQNITPLTDGVTPTGKTPQHTNVVATIEEYGDFIPITNRVDLFFIDDMISENVSMLSMQMNESMDSVVRDKINAGTTFFRSLTDDSSPTYGTGARTTVNGCITKRMCDAMLTAMHEEDAEYPEAKISASKNIGTVPIGEAFVAIIHPHVAHDLVNSKSGMGDDFVPIYNYPPGHKLLNGEVGAYNGVGSIRFVMTTNAKKWPSSGGTTGAGTTYRSSDGTNADVYSVLMIANNAYGVIPLPGASQTIRKGFGSAGAGDPMNQRATVAWIAYRTAAILNDAWLVRGEVAALL